MIRWERVTLPKGVHRIQRISRVTAGEVSICGLTDCTCAEWFVDDLSVIKAEFGISGGVWCGMASADQQLMAVLALRME